MYSALLGHPAAAFRREFKVRRLKSGSHHAGSQGASSAATVARTRDDFPTAPTLARYLARHISMYIVACRLAYTVHVFMPSRTSPDRLE